MEFRKSRDEIEQELAKRGFSVEFEDRDDQIWMNKKQNRVIFISWVDAEYWEYERIKKTNMMDG